MPCEDKDLLRIGRIEDKIKLYEPLLTSLPGLVAIPKEIGKINTILGTLKDSRIEVREKLATLFKMQDRVSDEIVKKLENSAGIMEKEIRECPIKVVELSVVNMGRDIERDVRIIKSLDGRLGIAEKTIETFKLKGWDLLFRIVPWILAACATTFAVLK